MRLQDGQMRNQIFQPSGLEGTLYPTELPLHRAIEGGLWGDKTFMRDPTQAFHVSVIPTHQVVCTAPGLGGTGSTAGLFACGWYIGITSFKRVLAQASTVEILRVKHAAEQTRDRSH